MGLTLIRDSKKKSEVHIFPADFTQQLSVGETITFDSWTFTVSLVTGVDVDPSAILFGTPTIVGNTVTQQLQQGVPGCIYRIVCRVSTSLSHVLSLETRLAVLPDDYPAQGVYVTYFETSQPYPLYLLPYDTLRLTAKVASSTLQSTTYNFYMADTLRIGRVTVDTSSLQSILYTQNIEDTFRITTAAALNGTLTTILVMQNETDTLHMSSAVLAGSLLTILINNNQTDTLHITYAKVLNGTLI